MSISYNGAGFIASGTLTTSLMANETSRRRRKTLGTSIRRGNLPSPAVILVPGDIGTI